MSEKPLHLSIYFDGTGNNKNNDKANYAHTNVARLYDLNMASGCDLSRNNRSSVNKSDPFDPQTGQSQKIYFDGVGSQPSLWQKPKAWIEGATGKGGQERVDQAYNAIVDYYNANPGGDIKLNMIGFSRGAAQARALANKVYKEGVPEYKKGKLTGNYLVPPKSDGVVNHLAIFDTVSSYANDQGSGLDLTVNRGVKSCTHFVADHEYRKAFAHTTAYDGNCPSSRIKTKIYPGSHAQVGGGEDARSDFLSAGPFASMYKAMADSGVEMRHPEKEDQDRIKKYNEVIKNPEALKMQLKDSRRNKAGVLSGEDLTIKDFNAAVEGRQTLGNDARENSSRFNTVLKWVAEKKEQLVEKTEKFFGKDPDRKYSYSNPKVSEEVWQLSTYECWHGKEPTKLPEDSEKKNLRRSETQRLNKSRPNSVTSGYSEAPVDPAWSNFSSKTKNTQLVSNSAAQTRSNETGTTRQYGSADYQQTAYSGQQSKAVRAEKTTHKMSADKAKPKNNVRTNLEAMRERAQTNSQDKLSADKEKAKNDVMTNIKDIRQQALKK